MTGFVWPAVILFPIQSGKQRRVVIIHHSSFSKIKLTMDELNQQLAALEVVDMLRPSHRMPLPAAGLVLEFGKLSCETMRRPWHGSKKIRTQRIITSFFGAKPLIGKSSDVVNTP
jgi:hypothetical protein